MEWEDEQVLNSEDDDEAEEESKSPLRLSSASVWALCPGLRPALAEHLTSALDATQAAHITDSSRLKVPLSFAVDASHEALLHVTRYVRCGTLLLPSASFGADLTLLLEMMKLATKWEMQSLLEEVEFTVVLLFEIESCSLS